MTTPGPAPEHVILIPRVSSGRQSEENQLPKLQAFADGRGYIVDAVVPIHGKSAFHGKHLKQVLKAIDDYIRNGNATVVIFRDVDRSSRQGAQATFDLRGEIIRAGGRMEFSGQEYLNDQRTQEMLLGLLATAAREESETKSRRKLQGNAARNLTGQVNGKAPWGYEIGTVNGLAILVPTALGREWIPRIYNLSVEGKSTRFIRDVLDSENVPAPTRSGKWNGSTVMRMLANPTYRGDRTGKGNMDYEALVSSDLWHQANLAVNSRAPQRRGTVAREAALARPYCGSCWGVLREGAASQVKAEDGTVTLIPSGKSPMYREIRARGEREYSYYGCRGHGPARKSCGAPVIPEAVLDQAIDSRMSADTRPHWVLEYIPGDDNAEAIARLNDAIALAGREMDYTRVAELAAEAEAVRKLPHRRGRAERRNTGMTVGKHWQTLDLAGKREELLKWEVIAWPDRVAIVGPWHDNGATYIGEPEAE